MVWYKDGSILSQALVKTNRDRHEIHSSLTLPSMSEQDYGNYSCVAKNNLGVGAEMIQITGKRFFK